MAFKFRPATDLSLRSVFSLFGSVLVVVLNLAQEFKETPAQTWRLICRIHSLFTRVFPKIMPTILFCCPLMSEGDIGGMAIED